MPLSHALIVVAVSCVLGFLGPEIWHAIREWVRRHFMWIVLVVGGVGFVYYLFATGALSSILVLGIMLCGVFLILRSIFPRRSKKK